MAAAILAMLLGLSTGGKDFTSEPPLQSVHNPLALSGSWPTAIDIALAAAVPLTIVALLGGAASMVLRFRRSTGTERQQVKWVVAGVLIWLVTFAVDLAFIAAGVSFNWFETVPFVLSIVLFPVVMALAILRYRLYDVDLVIRKTLVYACLIAVLGAVYLGGIAAAGLALGLRDGPVERGRGHHHHAGRRACVPAAAAADPARDRPPLLTPHGRRRDGAAGVLGRLREEIDLDALCSELTGVVEHTFQPRHTSLWLRSPEHG